MAIITKYVSAVGFFASMVACGPGEPESPLLGDDDRPCEPAPPEPDCYHASECPGVDTECARRVCKSGKCTVSLMPFGTQTRDLIVGDCIRSVCDGNGSTDLVPADDPINDRNDCTVDSCVDGVRVRAASPIGAPCEVHMNNVNVPGLCDDDGTCVRRDD